MKFLDYIYYMKLMGYELINVSYKKVMKNIERKRSKEVFNDFLRDNFDMKMVRDYFALGVKAGIFTDNRDKHVLGPDDQLFFGWMDKEFQYTLRRQPLVSPQQKAADINKMRQLLKAQGYTETPK